MKKLTDNRNANSKQLFCIHGKHSILEYKDNMNQYSIGKKANTSVLDIGFVVFWKSIAKYSHIRFDHASTESRYCFNKHMNQGHEAFITGRRTHPIKQKDIVVGLLHKLLEELRECLVNAGVENEKIANKYFDDALFRQCESWRLKEALALAIKWTSAKNEFVVDNFFCQKSHIPGKSFKEYNILGSEIQKLKAVR